MANHKDVVVTPRNVSTTLRQPSVEFKLGLLEFSSVLCDGSGSFLTKHYGAYVEGDDVGFQIVSGRHGGESKVGGQVHTFRIVFHLYQAPAYTTWQSLAEQKLGLKGARGARIASGD